MSRALNTAVSQVAELPVDFQGAIVMVPDCTWCDCFYLMYFSKNQLEFIAKSPDATFSVCQGIIEEKVGTGLLWVTCDSPGAAGAYLRAGPRSERRGEL